MGKNCLIVFLCFWALFLGFYGHERCQMKGSNGLDVRRGKKIQKCHFWRIFGHLKEKRSSTQNIEFPKKTLFFLAQTQNLRCQYMGNHFGDQFRTSKSDLDELFPFFQKISFFYSCKKKHVYGMKKNVKMAFYHQETLPINMGFRGKHFTDKKKSKFCLKKLFFSFELHFCPSGICDGKKAL